jgi:hypothetical protein
MFPYTKIIKQAWVITKTNKFLWTFGLFLFFGNLVNVLLSLPSNSDNSQMANYPTWAVWVGSGGLVLLILLFLFYFRAKVASVIAVKAIVEKQETSFSKSFAASSKYYWRVFGISVILDLILFALFYLLTTPIFYLWSEKLTARATVLTILGIGIFIPAWFMVQFANFLSPMFVSFYDLNILEGIRSSLDLIAKRLRVLVLFYLRLLGIGIVALLLVLIMAGLGAAPFVFFAVFAYYRGGFVWSTTLIVIGSILGSAIFLTLISGLLAFMQTAWALAFLEFSRPQKFEEEMLPEPEVV